jgi:hypothetical protein
MTLRWHCVNLFIVHLQPDYFEIYHLLRASLDFQVDFRVERVLGDMKNGIVRAA